MGAKNCCGVQDRATALKTSIKAPVQAPAGRHEREAGEASDGPVLPSCCCSTPTKDMQTKVEMPAPSCGHQAAEDSMLVGTALVSQAFWAKDPNCADDAVAAQLNQSPGHGRGLEHQDNIADEEQRRQAKQLVKDFVTTMVKGTHITVVAPSGEARACFFSLTRELDTLKVQARQGKDVRSRPIALSSIEEILVGTLAFQALDTSLDDFRVTLVLDSSDCVTFQLPDMEARDTLVMCLTMFCNEARSKVI